MSRLPSTIKISQASSIVKLYDAYIAEAEQDSLTQQTSKILLLLMTILNHYSEFLSKEIGLEDSPNVVA